MHDFCTVVKLKKIINWDIICTLENNIWSTVMKKIRLQTAEQRIYVSYKKLYLDQSKEDLSND